MYACMYVCMYMCVTTLLLHMQQGYTCNKLGDMKLTNFVYKLIIRMIYNAHKVQVHKHVTPCLSLKSFFLKETLRHLAHMAYCCWYKHYFLVWIYTQVLSNLCILDPIKLFFFIEVSLCLSV